MTKIIVEANEWDKVYRELENEVIKTSSYDNTIIHSIGEVSNKSILDYGSGPGMIASVLQKMGAKIDIFDVNKKILEMSSKRISSSNIKYDKNKIQKEHYDFVICNLVVCIVSDENVLNITKDIFNALKPTTGIAYVGFCNPLIYNIPESMLDIRYSGNRGYKENHYYYKEKKEGNYIVPEMHRPIEWYEEIFLKSGLNIQNKIFTEKYNYKSNQINDFIIFHLKKSS